MRVFGSTPEAQSVAGASTASRRVGRTQQVRQVLGNHGMARALRSLLPAATPTMGHLAAAEHAPSSGVVEPSSGAAEPAGDELEPIGDAAGPGTLWRQAGGADDSDDSEDPEVDCPEHPPHRAEEVRDSRTSPGAITGVADPLSLSLHNFGIDVATPKAEHTQVLAELATFFNAHSRAELRLHLVGHTDCTGGVHHNTQLSERRARAVRDALAPHVGRRIGITWASELHPVASNATAEGRSRNRRVDVRFVIVTPPPPVPPPPVPVPPGGTEPPPEVPVPEPPDGGERPPERDDDDDDGGGPSLPHPCLLMPLLCAGPGLPWLLPLVCLVAPPLCTVPVIPPPPPPPPPPRPPEPPEPDDPDRPRDPPQVVFVPDARAANTPAAMNDRISNGSPVAIAAVVTHPPPAGQTIRIDVDGGSARAGAASIDGGPSIDIGDTTVFELRGTALTAAGVGPHLQLGAWFGGDLVGASNQFAVSAIMENWTTSFDEAVEFPTGLLLYVKMHWASDGNSIRDLSECHYLEAVAVESESGSMRGMGIGEVQQEDEYGLAEIMPGGDRHGIDRRALTGRGFQRLHQLWQMRDTRSGSGWVPSRNSGFHIERSLERDSENPRCWMLTVTKKGGAASVGGATSAAGGGEASHVWHRINCDPPPPPPPPPEVEPPEIEPPDIEPPDPVPPEPSLPEAPTEPPCDHAELERRVDACVEEARQGAIDCTLDLIPFSPGWGGVGAGIDYWMCLEEMRRRLLECDREAKRDTHCPDLAIA